MIIIKKIKNTTFKMIPLIDLSLNPKLLEEIKTAIDKVVDSKSYILGERLKSFEEKFAKYLGADYAIGVGNGTDALRLVLRALKIGAGDKVLTVAFTSPFTSIAIVEEGATPIYCDVDEKTWTLDLADAAKKLDKNVRAIMPVHIYGNPCDMKAILKFAKDNNLKVIEDACQAHGAEINGKKAGTFGDGAAFSFYPTKNLGGMGDGGAVATNSEKLANQVRLLRHGGQTKRFWHEYRGFNSRLDEMQAAILEAKLKHLDDFNRERERLVQNYEQELASLPITFQQSFTGASSAHHLFLIRTKKRDALKEFLEGNEIVSDLYYPYPINAQPAFRKYSGGNLNITNMLSRELLALPLYPSMESKDQEKVISSIKRFFKKNG